MQWLPLFKVSSEIYRTSGKYDKNHTRIDVASAADTNFTDDDIEPELEWIRLLDSEVSEIQGDNNGGAMTSLGSLKSSRYYI